MSTATINCRSAAPGSRLPSAPLRGARVHDYHQSPRHDARGRVMSRGEDSIPQIFFLVLDVVLVEKRPVLLLKCSVPMMLSLAADIFPNLGKL